MGKPHVYINVAQCITIGGILMLGWRYLDIVAQANGVQRRNIRDDVVAWAWRVKDVAFRPFESWRKH